MRCSTPLISIGLSKAPPDHLTISLTRRVIDLESTRAVFRWVRKRLVAAGLLRGKTVALDGTTLDANAAMRSIVRRDTAASYQEFLTGIAQAGIATPTRGPGAAGSQAQEESLEPRLATSKIAKVKDSRTHLAHKA